MRACRSHGSGDPCVPLATGRPSRPVRTARRFSPCSRRRRAHGVGFASERFPYPIHKSPPSFATLRPAAPREGSVTVQVVDNVSGNHSWAWVSAQRPSLTTRLTAAPSWSCSFVAFGSLAQNGARRPFGVHTLDRAERAAGGFDPRLRGFELKPDHARDDTGRFGHRRDTDAHRAARAPVTHVVPAGHRAPRPGGRVCLEVLACLDRDRVPSTRKGRRPKPCSAVRPAPHDGRVDGEPRVEDVRVFQGPGDRDRTVGVDDRSTNRHPISSASAAGRGRRDECDQHRQNDNSSLQRTSFASDIPGRGVRLGPRLKHRSRHPSDG